MIGFYLSGTLDECPPSWKNFIEFHQGKCNSMYDDVQMNLIRKELKDFNAKYTVKWLKSKSYVRSRTFIEFVSDEDYTWFILKWA
jgi:hypothetical protein